MSVRAAELNERIVERTKAAGRPAGRRRRRRPVADPRAGVIDPARRRERRTRELRRRYLALFLDGLRTTKRGGVARSGPDARRARRALVARLGARQPSSGIVGAEVEHERAGLAGVPRRRGGRRLGRAPRRRTAVFRVGSMSEAGRLAEAVAAVPGIAGSGALLTVAETALTVRLSRDMWKLEPQHVELARSVSEVARAHGAVADRAAVQEVQFAVAAKPDAIDLGFWRAVLGYVPMGDDNGVDPLGHGSTVWMQDLDEAKPLRRARCTSTCRSRASTPRRGSPPRWPPAAGSWSTRGRPGRGILADRAGNRVCIAAWPDGAPVPDDPTEAPSTSA